MNIIVTGGAGYVGSLLIPELIKCGHDVIVYDLYMFRYIFKNQKNLHQIHGDIRDKESLLEASKNIDCMVHLASISNDPSFDLDPVLGKSINYDGTQNIIDVCKINDIKRLVVASSTSQYGIKPLDMDVTEDVEAEPITDYAKYKIMSEELISNADMDTEYVFARPSTLCGYTPRLRLDLAVNIMTINALVNKKILIFGGYQMRPTLNVLDMVRFYKLAVDAPSSKINKQAFNLACDNMTIKEIGELVKKTVGNVSIEFVQSVDKRSYHVNADKVTRVLGFKPKYTVEDGIRSLITAYENKLILDGLENPIYYNVKVMQKWR